MTEKKTVEELIDAAIEGDMRHEGEETVPLLKIVTMLKSDTPYILSVPNPEKPDTTMVVANGSEEELFNCAAAIVSWIGGMRENEVSRHGDLDDVFNKDED